MIRLFLRRNLCGNLVSPAAEPFLITVQQKLILFLLRHGNSIVLPFHRGHVKYKQQIILATGTFSHEAVCTVLRIIRVHPFKAVPGIVKLVQSRVFTIQL